MDNPTNEPSCWDRIKSIICGCLCWCYIECCTLCCCRPKYETLPDSSSIKVHMLVAGETFQTHDTFMQNLKLQIELCSAKSCNVILVFCPVVSRIGTDMEAAMTRVPENKPVILVFMHHCSNPGHLPNITVQPPRSNMQVVHCAFHESKGLLQCQENDQAVTKVRLMLQRYE